uniref:Class I SAM-dependent methyltransferase n=1 Tax=Chlorobium chlorochromatii (strain CaD3) TaxID=340177 RepID=Q3ASX4_CHLCH
MESTSCPICNTNSFTPWLHVVDRFEPSTLWNIVQAVDSGLLMLHPRPTEAEMAPYYAHAGYEPFLNSNKKSSLAERTLLFARSLLLHYRAMLIAKAREHPLCKAHILEVGCSNGELLHCLQQKHHIPTAQLLGVEPDAASAEYARKRFGLQVVDGVEKLPTTLFDTIILWHTLEHIHRVNETLAMLRERLTVNGIMVIALPNPLSYSARHYREAWIAWDAPRHLYHFTPTTLAALLKKHKLHIVKQQPYLPDTLFNTLYSEQLQRQHNNAPSTPLPFANALAQVTTAIKISTKELREPNNTSGIMYVVTHDA